MNTLCRNAHCLRTNGPLLVHALLNRSCRRPLKYSAWYAVRHSSRAAAAPLHAARPLGRVPTVRAFGFRELGIRDLIVDALGRAFPDVQRPTLSQAEFIPAILNGQDVLLHDETGTGKSFGTILALLNKPRAGPPVRAGKRQEGPCITSIVVVPHRDLGFQMMHWIKSILKKTGPHPPSLDSIAQLVVRGDAEPAAQQIRRLGVAPPHIVIGTPQALWEIYETDHGALQLDALATIVVDEVDYLLDIPPPYLRKTCQSAAWKNFRKHPSPARRLLEEILPMRKPGAVPLAEADSAEDEARLGSRLQGGLGAPPLQVVMSSATVHSNLIDYLCDAHWMKGDQVISGKQVARTNAHMIFDDGNEQQEVVHHAFVVTSDGKLSNVEFAVRPGEKDQTKGKEDRRPDSREKLAKSASIRPQSPTSPRMMEAVATFFAVDVPQFALLVLPPNSSVQKAISELQDLGINARMLDLRSGDIAPLGRPGSQARAEPTLLVATPSSIRGMDLPQLTHVFCVGAPDTASADAYKHVAGRVDRFGRGGKVITIITEREQKVLEGMMRTTKNPSGLLRTFYHKLGIKPVWFDLAAVDDFTVGSRDLV